MKLLHVYSDLLTYVSKNALSMPNLNFECATHVFFKPFDLCRDVSSLWGGTDVPVYVYAWVGVYAYTYRYVQPSRSNTYHFVPVINAAEVIHC